VFQDSEQIKIEHNVIRIVLIIIYLLPVVKPVLTNLIPLLLSDVDPVRHQLCVISVRDNNIHKMIELLTKMV